MIFLAVTGLVIPVMKRLRISPVLGFLLAGMAVGPYGLVSLADRQPWLRHVLIADVEGVRALAELGVVFLLFMIGLELSFERLWAMRRLVFGLGSAQVLVTGLLIGVIAWVFGNSVEASVVLGGCLALSSTAVVMQLFAEQGRMGTPVGHGGFAVLLAQDIAVMPILFVVGAFGAQIGGSLITSLAVALGGALLAVVTILGAGRLVCRPLFRFVSGERSPEVFVAATLLIIVATAAATHAAGLSAALGAFLVGLLLAETEFRYEIEVNIEPFKGLLLGLFFMSVGMGIDVTDVLAEPMWIALSVVGLFVIKAVVLAGLARSFGFNLAQAAELGLLLGQGGEFAFVVVGLAASLALVPPGTAQFMLVVVGSTMLLTPLVSRLARALGGALEAHASRAPAAGPDVSANVSGHVIIVGHGRTGQLLAELLEHQHVPHVSLDLDPIRVAAHRARGAPVYVGDARRSAILDKARLNRAAALIVSTDDPDSAEQVLGTARRNAPALPIIVRARDSAHAARLLALGATEVVSEVLEASLQLGHLMLEHIGLPREAAREITEAERGRNLSERRGA